MQRPAHLIMRVALVASVAALAALSGADSVARPSAAASTLPARLDAIFADSRLSGAEAALTVRDADTGATLYDRSGATRLLPASNAKLLTSAAAMDILGPGYRFDTSVASTGRRTGHILRGNLYLEGRGDPTAKAADYDELAAQIAAAGIREVRGRVVADDTWFDSARLAPFWSWDDEPYYYSAETSALNVAPNADDDTGTILVDMTPGPTVGATPRVEMVPANHHLRIRNTATTGAAGSEETVDATREHGRNVLDVTGSIPLGADAAESQTTVSDPTGLVGELFARALARHGVRVRASHIGRGATPQGADTVASHSSIPLSQLLVPFLKLSNNMIAEVLTKAVGRAASNEGTWAAGVDAILADAAANGVDTATLQLFDGSGLGRADYVTTEQFTNLLLGVRGKPWFGTWYDALPIAGEPDRLVGGTLRHRLAGTAAADNLHGKTGSMTGVSALSGYLTDAAGEHLVFSMISNDFVQGGITAIEDAVAVTLADNGGPDASSRVRPAQVPRSSGPRAQLECSWTRTC